ncbi:MAG: agmatine deiminase family protein, partial [Phycisphaerales bacterium]|nr:agmatine deiminase family protein [Phycisphaerales bacterium]
MSADPRSTTTRRWPAEWEPHDATWLCWPHNEEDWPGKFGPIDWAFAEMARLIAGAEDGPGERVEILCHNEEILRRARLCCQQSGCTMGRVGLHLCANDRGWVRDAGPTIVRSGIGAGGGLELIDWRFNAWAKYDNFALDDAIPAAIERLTRLPRVEPMRPDGAGRLVMEGGAIETDGAGLLLATDECLMDQRTQARNPGLTRAQYER